MSPSREVAFVDFAANESGDTAPFYQAEGQILELWDQLNELKLEQALWEAQTTSEQSGEQQHSAEVTVAEMKDAEKEYLEARAAYVLRQSVVEDVLIADPILKAVHSGANATPTERHLHPLIDRRDILGIALTNLSATLQSLIKDIVRVEAENIRTMERNRELTTTLLVIARKGQDLQSQVLQDSGARAQLDRLEGETATARNRWRIMKNVAGAIVAGSGVDWARNDNLKDVVLNDEQED